MDSEAFKNKSESLATKMNKITSKFEGNLDTADDLVVTGNDVIEFVEAQTQDVQLYSSDLPVEHVLNLQNMVDDFKYVRDTLKENADNGRRVLNVVTLKLLEDSEDSTSPELIESFASLNRAVAENIKLYIWSYKEISVTLVNMEKVRQNKPEAPTTVNNTVNINNAEPISTVDLIKKLGNSKGDEE